MLAILLFFYKDKDIYLYNSPNQNYSRFCIVAVFRIKTQSFSDKLL